MPSRFCPIMRDEIHEFLTGLGFVPITIKGVVELVYAKVVPVGGHRLSLRIYTAVNPDGESRDKGTDAIRLQLFAKIEESIVPVGRSQKCLRVESWRTNLLKAIQRHADSFRLCPACGSPMVLRHNGNTGDEFWGCTMFRFTGCRGRRSDGPWPRPQQGCRP